MTYVTWVFQKLFGYSREKAEQLMLDVHHKGRAVVSSGARERMEHDAVAAARLRALGRSHSASPRIGAGETRRRRGRGRGPSAGRAGR